MRRSAIIACVVWRLLAVPQDRLGIHVPHTPSEIMIDGNLSEGEWNRAAKVEIPGVARIYFQQSSEFVDICIEYMANRSGIVDLYLSPEQGQIYDFHASAKLGERKLSNGTFDEWTWWNNREWVANVSRVDSFEKKTFLPARIREYQIRKSRFLSPLWRVRFELTTMVSNSVNSVTYFPSQTTDNSTDGWLLLSLK